MIFRVVTIRRVLVWMIGFINTLYIQLGTTGNTAPLLISSLYSSLLHMHKGSQSSLVVSWQWIYNSLTVTATNVRSPFLSCHFFSVTFYCRLSVPCCKCQLWSSTQFWFLCSQAHILAGWNLKTQQQQKLFNCCLHIHCHRNGCLLWFHYSGFRVSCHISKCYGLVIAEFQLTFTVLGEK
jgi:hypothetical protein